MIKLSYIFVFIAIINAQETATHNINFGFLNQTSVYSLNYEYTLHQDIYASVGLGLYVFQLDQKRNNGSDYTLPISMHYQFTSLFDLGLGVMFSQYQPRTSLLIGFGSKKANAILYRFGFDIPLFSIKRMPAEFNFSGVTILSFKIGYAF